ncbi:hypothetical protein [Streptomyces sp. NRRL WC-3549]|nr:hypothetical protein [Streptomyces sp. NRRL WC-3549]
MVPPVERAEPVGSAVGSAAVRQDDAHVVRQVEPQPLVLLPHLRSGREI